ncbi:helix-turn-helix transcriptional regulator [Roseisolibacter agri]|nr:helix-turn-helix transcriptional regulator [Roseisolibacter agri]
MSPLATADLARLEHALRVALCPADHGSASTWSATLCRAAADLVGGGAYGTVLAMSERTVHRVLHTDVPDDIDRVYRAEFAAQDLVQTRMLARRLPVGHELDVCTREELARSPFYNEFSLALGVPFSFGVSAFRGASAPHRLMLTLPRWPDDAARDRAAAMLRLLAPAFAAGVEAVDRLTADPAELARLLDVLAEPTLVCDRRGTVLHENPACAALLADVRLRAGAAGEASLRAELRALAAGVGALRGGRAAREAALADAPPAAARELRVGTQRLRARACFTAEGTLAAEALVWVSVERAGAEAAVAAPDALRARFGLTAQECAVARLLADRRTDAEIATTLGVSPHTARTHAERVRRKLGVARRTEVAARIAEA